MHTKFVSISSYSPEVCTFGTLITSTKVSLTETRKRMHTKFVSISSYSPEVCTFGTLITSTKVSLIICKTLCQNDPLPRDFRLYLDILDSVPN